MIAAMVLLAMAGVSPTPKPVPPAIPAVRVNIMRSQLAPQIVVAIVPRHQEAAVCAAHMELLMEKLSARAEEPDASFMMVQEYWQGALPDPDGKDAISDVAFSNIKDSLDSSANTEPQVYLQGLQECVVAAVRGGALH